MGIPSRLPTACLLLLLWCTVAPPLNQWGAEALSSGAPTSACSSMTPSHGNTPPQTSAAPFQVTPGGVSVNGGTNLQVTLATVSPTGGFKGFLLQARDANSSLPVGTFVTDGYKLLTCGSGFNNAVTHANPSAKVSVVLDWTSPANYEGEVVFKATVVQDYSTYWSGITSEKVTVKRSVAATPAVATNAATTTIAPAAVSDDGVGLRDSVIKEVPAPVLFPTVAANGLEKTRGGPSPGSASPDSAPGISRDPSSPSSGGSPLDSNDSITSGSTSSGSVFPIVSDTTFFSTPDSSPAPVVSSFANEGGASDSIGNGQETSNDPSPNASVSSTAKEVPNNSGGADSEGTTKKRGLLGGFRGRPTEATTVAASTTTATPPPRVRIAGKTDGPLASAIDSIYLGCSVNKGCFGLPNNCDAAGNCESLFTYTRTTDGYQFEIMGKVNPSTPNAYVAGGLSFDDNMGDDSVMACRSFNGVADITMAWNRGYSNSILADQKQGLSNFEMKQIDGKLYCRFTRAAKMEIEKKVFDLDNDKFNVMVAKGALTADGSLLKHSDRAVSSKSVAMTEFETLGSGSELFVVLHASFMVAAWVGAASSGILLARYFKMTWKGYKACGIDQWFHFHRLFMVTTWCLTIAAFVLIVVEVEGWTDVPANVNPHAYIGIVSIALCFIQPFIAMCRCAPTDSRRPVFNWIHWFVGNAAQILGITAIFFGLELYGMPMWTWWIMIVFVGFHFVTHVILSIGECVSDSKAKNQVSGIPMKEFNSSRDMLQPQQDKVLDAPGGTFRKAMLALYLVVVWLLVALLLVAIIAGNDQLKEWGFIFWEKK